MIQFTNELINLLERIREEYGAFRRDGSLNLDSASLTDGDIITISSGNEASQNAEQN